MSSTTNADGSSDGSDLIAQLSRISNRTSLMVIDATLNALPQGDTGHAKALAEVLSLSRRMAQATQDLQATIREPAA
jgi:hypothetical protein